MLPVLVKHKTLQITLVVVFLGMFAATLQIKYYYTRNRPEAPQTAQAWICPARVYYMKTVYVSKSEKRLLDWIPLIQGSLIVVAATLGALLENRRKTKANEHHSEKANLQSSANK